MRCIMYGHPVLVPLPALLRRQAFLMQYNLGLNCISVANGNSSFPENFQRPEDEDVVALTANATESSSRCHGRQFQISGIKLEQC